MKRIILFFLSVFLLIGCEQKEEEPLEGKNQIEFAGDTYPIDWGILNYGGLYNEAHIYNLMLMPKEFQLFDDKTELRGSGTSWAVRVLCSAQNLEGDFKLVDETQNGAAGLMTCPLLIINLTMPYSETAGEEEVECCLEGDLQIIESGGEYEIIYTGRDSRGIPIELNYKGTLIELDEFL